MATQRVPPTQGQMQSHTKSDFAFFTKSLRSGHDSGNPHNRSHQRAELMRRDRRSALREGARSKLREGNSQQVKDILEEFGFNPEEPHEMIDLQAPNNMENEISGKKGALTLTQTKH